MRAVVLDRSVTFLPDQPDPRVVDGECLVQVHIAGICATDLQLAQGYLGFRGILGHEMVGTVVEGSSDWVGKRVVGEINCVCRSCEMCQAGLSNHCRKRTVLGIDSRDGCFADLVALPERNLHTVPDSIQDEEAVFVEPLAAAYQILTQLPVDKRMTVTVVGSGRLGLLAAQVLATTGCRLTVVGRNHKTLSHCEKKGVQAIHVDELVAQADRDLVVDCSGAAEGLELSMSLVRPRGTIVLKSTYAKSESLNLAPIVLNEVNVIGSRCGPFPEAINALARQAVEVRSMISKTFPIEKALEAFEAAQNPQNIKVLLKINQR